MEIIDDFDKSSIKILDHDLDIKGLLQLYKNLDLLIATRMHSAIFSLSVGTPVIAIAYDHGGKWSILDMMNAKELIIDIDKVNPENLLNLYNKTNQSLESLMPHVAKGVSKCMKDVDKNIANAKEFL